MNEPTNITSDIQLELLEKELGKSDVIRIHTFEYENEYFGHTTVTRILLKEPVDVSRVTRLAPIPARLWKLFERGVCYV